MARIFTSRDTEGGPSVFGEAVIGELRQRGWTQVDLAIWLYGSDNGCARQRIYNLLRQKPRKKDRKDDLRRVCELFGWRLIDDGEIFRLGEPRPTEEA